jgi:L-asparaginase / beta-aspartyl-peptidase
MAPIAIGIHGGCGTLEASLMSDAEWVEARAHLADALRVGWNHLAKGGRSLDAVVAAVTVMEDSWHFNAGFGAALNAAGEHELDASVMDGATFGAGAVCGVRQVRNPIRAARAVMERSPSVLIAGSAADAFAASCGLDMVANGYFTTDRRRAALAAIKVKEASGQMKTATEAEKHGTVGAVALDADGNLAAGTSTGGFNNKPVGRVGDSPIIGAGTYARNGVCAVSCTGQGEIFIKRAAAFDVAARMMYVKADLAAATGAVVETLGTHNIGAGLVACDSHGNVVAPFNTLGMYRGWVTRDGDMIVATHRTEVHLGRLA